MKRIFYTIVLSIVMYLSLFNFAICYAYDDSQEISQKWLLEHFYQKFLFNIMEESIMMKNIFVIKKIVDTTQEGKRVAVVITRIQYKKCLL